MMTRIFISNATLHAALLALGFVFSSSVNAAGLVEVKQTVFGMDCAPCAHGVENGLEKLDGVQEATVSLNEGYAAVTLAPDNAITLEKIREVIRDNGFTPKEATVVVSGSLTRADNRLVLAGAQQQRYSLAATPDAQAAWQQLQALPEGAAVEIKARVDEDSSTQLAVLTVQPDPQP